MAQAHSHLVRRGPGPSDAPPHIVVEGLQKRFGNFVAPRDIDMQIPRGDVTVIIGGSGAGNTTLLKILIGLDRATAGSIRIDDLDITKVPERELNRVRRRFGMVFQYSALLDSMESWTPCMIPTAFFASRWMFTSKFIARSNRR